MQYIDLHTHQPANANEIQIRNIFAQDLPLQNPEYYYSAGAHPWHIGEVNFQECLQKLETEILQKNLLAIGECGLDRSIATDFAIQEKCFIEQVVLAETHRKPLIIHAVRAYSDLQRIKKNLKSDIPWVLHGYRANREITRSLVKNGFYFSAGIKLLNDAAKNDVLRMIPIERLFLETDDSEISIQKIYLFASQTRMMEEELLAEAIQNNFKLLFGDDKLAAKN
jgi:TatD DNase family protein